MRDLKLRMPRYVNLTTMEDRETFLLEKMHVLITAVNRNNYPIDNIIIFYEAIGKNSLGQEHYEILSETYIGGTSDKYKILEGVCTAFVPTLTPDIKLLLQFSKSKLD